MLKELCNNNISQHKKNKTSMIELIKYVKHYMILFSNDSNGQYMFFIMMIKSKYIISD